MKFWQTAVLVTGLVAGPASGLVLAPTIMGRLRARASCPRAAEVFWFGGGAGSESRSVT